MARLGEEQVMVAEGMVRRGTSMRQVAEQLGVPEGAVRYRLRKRASGPAVVDGRTRSEDDRHRLWRHGAPGFESARRGSR